MTTATTPAYVPPSISIVSIPSFTMAGTDVLDKTKTNWHLWKCQTSQHLKLCGLFGYVNGTITQPDLTMEPKVHENWKTNDTMILAYFGLRAAKDEQDEIDKATSSKLVWDELIKQHKKQGVMTQILLIQEAFTL